MISGSGGQVRILRKGGNDPGFALLNCSHEVCSCWSFPPFRMCVVSRETQYGRSCGCKEEYISDCSAALNFSVCVASISAFNFRCAQAMFCSHTSHLEFLYRRPNLCVADSSWRLEAPIHERPYFVHASGGEFQALHLMTDSQRWDHEFQHHTFRSTLEEGLTLHT
jgi:hypothetical protein